MSAGTGRYGARDRSSSGGVGRRATGDRATDAPLRDYLDAFLTTMRPLHYADLVRIQPPPHATLFHGGAGMAYALWRLGETAQARRWAQHALADRRRGAFAWGYAAPATSFLFGRAGLHWVHALLGDEAAATRFRRLAARAGDSEFIDGMAGYLTGARLLLARREDAALRRAASALAARLAQRVRRRSGRPWRERDAAGGFAHDWAGQLHALLEWHRATGEAPPAWLVASLHRLAAAWDPAVGRRPGLQGAWCQGATGMVLLWGSAYRTTGERAFLQCARAAGRVAARADHGVADLCCGSAGAAFGLLELDAVDPGRGWREAAHRLGLQAVQAEGLVWPYGLFRGHAGLACLALDLLAERPVGFPAVLG